MKTPTPDQMRLAAMWLDHNEGDGSEGEACKAVAEWLEAQADAKYLRDTCRAGKIPVAAVRSRLKAE